MIAPTRLPEDSDDKLIRRVVNGDGRAFEVLYARYAPRLRGYLQAHLGEADLAEDACQEVLLIVWTTAERFQHASKLSTWIYGIAWRVAHRTRRHWARCPPLQSEAVESHVTSKLDPTAGLEQQERQRALMKALETLPQPMRRTVVLRYQFNYTSQEIANEMTCSISQVNYRLQDAQRRLTVILRRQKSPFALAG